MAPSAIFSAERLTRAITRSQDLPPLYCPTGAFWIAERDAFLETRNFYMEGHRFEPMHWVSAVDIVTERGS